MRGSDRLAETETLYLRSRLRALLLEPIVDDRAFGNSPLSFPLLKQVTVSSAKQNLPDRPAAVRSALKRGEVALDGGFSRADELDQNVRDLMDVARFRFEDTERELNEAFGRAGIGPVVVIGIRPVGAAQRRLIRAVYPPAVSIEAVADRLPVKQFDDFFVVHGLVAGSKIEVARLRIRLRSNDFGLRQPHCSQERLTLRTDV